MSEKGKLIILSGPSAVGKGTVIEALMAEYQDIAYSISATTRKPRSGEKDGVDYFFLSEKEFKQKIKEDEFIEWAEVHGNYYGTPKDYVEDTMAKGQDVILEIDIQGAAQVKDKYAEEVFIFLAPPSLKELESRIHKRGTDSKEAIEVRMENATEEMEKAENYDYMIVNDKVEKAVEQLKAIIIAERCKID
ncbi:MULTISPECIES: guanylate kinase [unclassified Candidatus Frackibacter]|uniref:guanylate kinase n=1 Tax=unclassified Candidatus Frackibacter TaxID=2648818 RepID=UPI00079957D6|nr:MULTISPECIES: guanylate kinase [unclassified Candidatus Frackibacter]KXS43332.1 MAG: guanylate kinase [Candidatus Frackibacter sp. T328-2]SDC57941.1 guanylate kinase [Candidatus Frackibacter sp. WG11]SEM72039.1 guanylate kinase [Candidatus Frackibacter sp. WG12]SFL82248.1 guanylate kinase [Candidatus Frackibacter sp. WG13]